MKKLFFVFAAILFFSGNQDLFAQNTYNSQQKTFRVGIFAPLYLDSVFENSQLRSDKTIPK